MNTILDKCRGSLLGGAIGDALGYAVEFSSLSNILLKYGQDGIADYELDNKGVARFSDDTQMTLFTADGLLTSAQNGTAYDANAVIKNIERSYLVWYATQTAFQLPDNSSWLSNIYDLWARRAPGNTCINALRQIKIGKPVNNDSKGCGGVMRVAPIGIFYAANSHEKQMDSFVAKVAAESAYITHHHDMSTLASALAALVVYKCMKADSVDRATFRNIVEASMPVALDILPNSLFIYTFEDLIIKSLDLAESNISDRDAIKKIGEGWVAEETIAIALFSVMRHIDDFEKCMVCSVNHDGDSDSTGAVAGNIIGAIIGYEEIPKKYKENLELKDVLLSIADDLAGVSDETTLKERYINHKPYGLPEELTLFSHMKFTPEKIMNLDEDEIFVFGSNLAGRHLGGAARVAAQKFGAIYGQGVGLQGQSYAIPTMQGGVETIKPYVDEFIEFARNCDQNTFYVTRIGCGIAGFSDEEIAPLFREALTLYNVRLPKSFVKILLNS